MNTEVATLKQELFNALSNIKQFQTTLLIGSLALTLFKQMYKGHIYTLKTAEEVRDFIERFNYVSNEVVVFEDLSLMTKEVQTFLLKFIEEPTHIILALCTNDNVPPALRSRFVRTIKIEEPITLKMIPLQQFIQMKLQAEEKLKTQQRTGTSVDLSNEEQLILNDLPKACQLLCPDYWYWSTYVKMNCPYLYNADKYLSLLL